MKKPEKMSYEVAFFTYFYDIRSAKGAFFTSVFCKCSINSLKSRFHTTFKFLDGILTKAKLGSIIKRTF